MASWNPRLKFHRDPTRPHFCLLQSKFSFILLSFLPKKSSSWFILKAKKILNDLMCHSPLRSRTLFSSVSQPFPFQFKILCFLIFWLSRFFVGIFHHSINNFEATFVINAIIRENNCKKKFWNALCLVQPRIWRFYERISIFIRFETRWDMFIRKKSLRRNICCFVHIWIELTSATLGPRTIFCCSFFPRLNEFQF